MLSHSSTKSSLTSPGKDVCFEGAKNNILIEFLIRYCFSLQSRSSSIQTNNRPMTIHQEQITIVIRRPSNTGLGISIAGGIGSTPFKDNDYVTINCIEEFVCSCKCCVSFLFFRVYS